jgi:hypothetical protein
MTPTLPTDFRDMLSALSDAGAEFLVVGAYAMAAHGLPRATGDLDVWVRADPANAERVLVAFGAPTTGLRADDFSVPDQVVQLGVSPYRVDLLTSIDGVTFGEAWPAREEVPMDGLNVPVLSRRHLVQNKRATDRPQDRIDVERLEQTR